MQLILASQSPRRKEILNNLNVKFIIIPSDGEEIVDISLPPEKIVTLLAVQKAESVYQAQKNNFSDLAVLGADTIVYFKGEVLGKPKNRQNAVDILKKLSRKTHFVYTGVCLIINGVKTEFFDKSKVVFNRLSDEFINNYVDSGKTMDKAGGYGIQDGNIVKNYVGSYSNIVGLPKEKVKKTLKDNGLI